MKDFFRHNGILILIAAILLALVTAVVSMLLGGKANPLANLVGIVTTPVRNGISAVTNWAEERYSDAFEQEQMKEELEALKQENAELKAKEREYEAAIQENQRLYNLLELTPKDKQFTKEAAMVTARSTSNWESTLTLSKGTNQGIAVDNCVVDEYWNLVGVVAEVGENWCTVRTLIDANMELGGQLVRTGGAAILEGDLALMEEGKLKLTYLPENSQLMSGDLVTTSGRGGVYPSGLVAGHVEEVRTDASGMTDYAVIVPETDLDNLQQVFVIKDFTIVE
ncbi:rod shape-determining protein MreC [Flavonifractor sp. AGMB03687]|uniref:rod shape-determining protein MreC n=1 Tax=Flavonifractor sp. AGMB03687 TaxID=2785133 RepID=UPI001AE0D2FA